MSLREKVGCLSEKECDEIRQNYHGKIVERFYHDMGYKSWREYAESCAKDSAVEAWAQADYGYRSLEDALRAEENGDFDKMLKDCAESKYFLESALRHVCGVLEFAKGLKEGRLE